MWEIPQSDQNGMDVDAGGYESVTDREPRLACEAEQKGDVTGLEVNFI